MKARKGDLVAYAVEAGYAHEVEGRMHTTYGMEWHLGVVGSATRDGVVKSIDPVWSGNDYAHSVYVSGAATPVERILRLQPGKFILPVREGWSLESVLAVLSARTDVLAWQRDRFDSVEALKSALVSVRPVN